MADKLNTYPRARPSAITNGDGAGEFSVEHGLDAHQRLRGDGLTRHSEENELTLTFAMRAPAGAVGK